MEKVTADRTLRGRERSSAKRSALDLFSFSGEKRMTRAQKNGNEEAEKKLGSDGPLGMTKNEGIAPKIDKEPKDFRKKHKGFVTRLSWLGFWLGWLGCLVQCTDAWPATKPGPPASWAAD